MRLLGAAAIVTGALLGAWGCAIVAGVDFEHAAMDSQEAAADGATGSNASPVGQAAGSSTTPPTCEQGKTPCNGACVDTSSDLAHCGGCNQPCGSPNSDSKCTAGRCEVTCHPGFADCTNTPAKTCSPTPKWYVDDDGDGWGTSAFTTGCTKPVGHAALTGDCLDTNADVHPDAGANFVAYVGPAGRSFDYDCDGVETQEGAGVPNFDACTSTCNEVGILPAGSKRTGVGVNDFCGSNALRTCRKLLGCRTADSSLGPPVSCR